MTLPTQAEFLEGLAGSSSLPTGVAGDKECPICYEAFAEPIKTDCGHLFCTECARTWFESAHTCPSCRTPLYEAPEDYEDSDEDDDEDSEDEEEDEHNVWVDGREEPEAREFTVVSDSDDPFVYTGGWKHIEELDDGFELDMDDTVLRQALVYLCIEVAASSGNENEVFNLRPDWDGPTLITRHRLKSQVLAALTALNPRRWIGRETGQTATREAACHDMWIDAGHYLLNMVDDLCNNRPKQSARSLRDCLLYGWHVYLVDEGLTMPEFDERLNVHGTFDELIGVLFAIVAFFAQDAAKRCANVKKAWRLAFQVNDQDESVDKDGVVDGDNPIEEIGLKHEAEESSAKTVADNEPFNSSDNMHTTSSAPMAHATDQPLSSQAESLLRKVTADVESYIVARDISCYTVIAKALIKKSIGCTRTDELYEKVQAGPFSSRLCEEVQASVEAGSGCAHDFE